MELKPIASKTCPVPGTTLPINNQSWHAQAQNRTAPDATALWLEGEEELAECKGGAPNHYLPPMDCQKWQVCHSYFDSLKILNCLLPNLLCHTCKRNKSWQTAWLKPPPQNVVTNQKSASCKGVFKKLQRMLQFAICRCPCLLGVKLSFMTIELD